MTDANPLRQRIAAAIHRYDNHHALSGNDIPSRHHLGEADFVLAELRAELGRLDQPEPAAWTPPPPGDRREQLPDDLLRLIRGGMPDYISTACVTADALAVAVHWSHPRRAELGQWAERMHTRCRTNQKYTRQLCACGCHPQTEPAAT